MTQGKACLPVGKVWLVGAGPGDAGLITVAALERLRQADVIVYDRLVSPRLLEHPDLVGAEMVFVGKIPHTFIPRSGDRRETVEATKNLGSSETADSPRPEGHDQDAINRLLVEKAREGAQVVRLKGGDPFVFGRGGEEAEALRAAGIPFEVVPGVTSAVAVPAYAGIPVTHRGVAATFAVVTGHEDPDKDEPAIDWGRLATAVDTLVLLMGVETLPEIIDKLIAGGRPADTPVAVIRWGTTPDQSTVTGTLGDIVRLVREAKLQPPAITVVGEVVRLRETLAWFESRPLFGKRVLITRTRRQASVMARLLAAEGAVPIELPAIEIEPVADEAAVEAALGGLCPDGRPDGPSGASARASASGGWAVFTSANAVEVFFGLMKERRLDARAFAGARVAAIGPATADALSERGIIADAVPSEYIAEAVVEAMRPHLRAGDRPGGRPSGRVLVPRAEGARPELIEGLRSLGAEVDEVTLYRAIVPKDVPAEALALLRGGGIDIVTFTSSSTVRNLAAMLDGDVECLRKPLVACIGPITAATARELGLRVDVEAAEHTVPGLVAAIREHLLRGRSGRP